MLICYVKYIMVVLCSTSDESVYTTPFAKECWVSLLKIKTKA